MLFEEFSKIVEYAKAKRPIWFDLEQEKKSTESDIADVEGLLLIKLPNEYKEFVKRYGGGYFAFTNIFSTKKDSDWNIYNRNKKAGFLNSKSFLAISDNGTGDFYGVKVINEKCESKIYFYDHEDNIINPTEFEDIFDFLIKVGLTPR